MTTLPPPTAQMLAFPSAPQEHATTRDIARRAAGTLRGTKTSPLFPQAPVPAARPDSLELLELAILLEENKQLKVRAETAERQLHTMRHRNICRELLEKVTVREITRASAFWAPETQPALTLIERAWLWLTERR